MKFSGRSFLIVVLLLEVNFIFGQENNISVLDLPEKYLVPIEDYNYKKTEARINGKPWEVFSDRQYNRTYILPGNSSVFKTLDYFGKYYVIEENDKYVRICATSVYERQEDIGELDFGWIEKENMLLWTHCLIDKMNFADKKVIMINTPQTNHHFIKTDHAESNFIIYYIFKEKNSLYLLSKKPRIPGNKANIVDEFIGWIPEDDIIILKNNLFTEPNWKKDAVKEREDLNIKAQIYYEKSSAKKTKKGKKAEVAFVWSEQKTGRANGKQLRYPILDISKGIITTMDFTLNPFETNKNGMPSGKAYNSMFSEALSYNLFNIIMLLDRLEFGDLLDFNKSYLKFLEDQNNFLSIYDFWIEVMNNHPERFEDIDLSKFTINDINYRLFGAFNPDEKIGTIPLIQVGELNLYEFSGAKSTEYRERLSQKCIEIERILNQNNYEYSFNMNDITYYWVSVDYLP